MTQWRGRLPPTNVAWVRFRLGATCGLSLLLVLPCSKGFSPGSPVFLPPQKPTNPIGIADPHEKQPRLMWPSLCILKLKCNLNYRWCCWSIFVFLIVFRGQFGAIFINILFYFIGECIEIWVFLFLLCTSCFVVTPVKQNRHFIQLYNKTYTEKWFCTKISCSIARHYTPGSLIFSRSQAGEAFQIKGIGTGHDGWGTRSSPFSSRPPFCVRIRDKREKDRLTTYSSPRKLSTAKIALRAALRRVQTEKKPIESHRR